MTTHPMIEQVARLVGNLLASGADVWLPDVGSLYIERRAARKLSKRSIVPPCRVVSFSSQQRGVSLVDEIARAGQCAREEAQEIYDRWLSRVREGEMLTIEGIGVLKHKHFTLADPFDSRLNPQGHAPVKVASGSGSDWVLWLGVVAILAAVGIFGYQFMPDFLETHTSPKSVVSLATTVVDSPTPQPIVADSVIVDTLSQVTVEAEPVVTDPTFAVPATVVEQPPVEQPVVMVAGRKYVVLGVFSTSDNALRAVAAAQEKDASLRCGVYRFGDKLLVAAFDSPNVAECATFIREHSASFSDLWTYTAR